MWCCNLLILVVVKILLSEAAAQNVPPVMINDPSDPIEDNYQDIGKGEIPRAKVPIPTRQELLRVIDSMTGLTEEQKDKLRYDVLNGIKQDPPVVNINRIKVNPIPIQAIVFMVLLGLLTLIFVFLFYKLHTIIASRERHEPKRNSKKSRKNK